MLGREPEHPGVGVYRLLPLYGPAAEGARPVVQAPGHPDAEALGRAAALPPDHRLQVVNSLDHPDELLRLHQVEGDGPVHALPLWDDALDDVPEHRGLHEAGLDAVLVQGLLGQGEIVRVPGQGVLLVQGEEAVLEGPWTAVSQARMRSLLASLLFSLVCLMLRARSWRWPSPSRTEMAASLASITTRSAPARSSSDIAPWSAALFSRARRSRKAAEALLLVTGDDAVGHGRGDSLPEPLLEGAVDVLAGGAGALGDGLEGLPEGGLVGGVGTGGLGGELDHLLPSGLVGLEALWVVLLQEAGLLAAETAGPVQRLEELAEGHGMSVTFPATPSVVSRPNRMLLRFLQVGST